MYKIIRIFAAAGLLLSAFSAIASNPINYDTSKWTIHQSFENKPRKIIDTPDVVYFFGHSRLYSPTANAFTQGTATNPIDYYNTYGGSIFFYDKKNPAAGMQSLASSVQLSGYDMRLVNYNPVKKHLVIAYADGGIDIVSPDHSSITYISDLKNRIKSGATLINSINFDPDNGDIWLGTGAGFAQIDGTRLQVLRSPEWDNSVSDIVPVGDNIVAATGTTILMAPKTSNFALRDSYVTQTCSTVPKTITNIMPLSASMFAIADTSGQIYWVAPNGANKLTVTNPKIQGTIGNVLAPNTNDRGNYVVNRLDHTVTPTANGFYIAASDYGYFINRPMDGANPTFSKVQLPGSGHGVYNASYDGSKFWFYNGPGKFISKTYSGSSWSDNESLSPNGPQTAYDNFILYSPTQGLVLVNKHPHVLTERYINYQNTIVSAYKNGKWTDLSPFHHKPAIAIPGSAAETAFNKMISDNAATGTDFSKDRYPVSLPLGAAIDPLNPDVLFVSSPHDPGYAAVFLDDPTKTPLIDTKDNNTSFDALFPSKNFPNQANYASFGPTKLLGADANGVIWIYYNTSSTKDHTGDLMFFAITPEDRQEAIDTADPSVKKINVRQIVAPSTMSSATRWIYGTTLKHPSNITKLATSAKNGDAGGLAIRIFDHKGTLDDTTDDELIYIRKFRLPSGELEEPTTIRDIIENPVTGDIIVPAFRDTYIFNLSSPVENGVIDARTMNFTSENGQSVSFRPAARGASACVDEYGRLWVATHDNGVIGVSPDGKSIVAQFNSTNSPIGNDDVHSVGWNPETQSLFISARDVVAEVKIDAPADTGSGTSAINVPVISPEFVSPGFAGTVAIYNIPSGVSLRIRNSQGKTLRELEVGNNGVAHWDLLDNEGNLVPSDRYTILDATGTNTFAPIVLPVVR